MTSHHQRFLSMLYSETTAASNVTGPEAVTEPEGPSVLPGEIGDLPEPVPDWETALDSWRWGWQLHTYGFGAGFFLLALYAVVAIFEFRRRLKVQQYLLGINSILFLLGVSRSLYLLVDPYHSTMYLPAGLSQVLYGLTFPCLTSSFSLIQMVFMRITKVRMGPNKLQNYRVLAAIITSHFTIVIVIDVTVAYRNNLKLLLLLCQSLFITWGLVLCFGFVYGGFKMTQFTNETRRVLRQLVAYNRVKQETLRNHGDPRQLALHRITKPRIRVTDDENRTLSCASGADDVDDDDDSSAIGSSDTLSFYNEAHLVLGDDDEMTLARAYRMGPAVGHLRPTPSCIGTGAGFSALRGGSRVERGTRVVTGDSMLRQREALNRSDSVVDLSSESDYVTDTPSTAGPVLEEYSNVKRKLQGEQMVEELEEEEEEEEEGGVFEDVDLMSQSVCSSTAPMLLEETESSPPGFIFNPALELSDTVLSHVRSSLQGLGGGNGSHGTFHQRGGDIIANGYIASGVDLHVMRGHKEDNPGDVTSSRAEVISLDEMPQESGYMADTELNSPVRRKKRSRGRYRGHAPTDNEEDDDDVGDNGGNNSSPAHQPYPLKTADGTVSLYRIRQGRVLHKTLRITYLTTLFGFISCILHLYAMFGVYGVLSKDGDAEPWPWFAFHTFYRLTELAMSASMAVTTFYFSKQRHRAAIRRKHREMNESQTKC